MPDVIIDFVGGGPLDGKVLCSDSPSEIERDKVRWITWMVGAGVAQAAKTGKKPASFVTWRQPSEAVSAKAKEEGWTEARIAAMMPYYEYEFTDVFERDGFVYITARFTRTSS